MERIKALYATLKQPEKKFLITYLTAFHPKGENKTLELLELIEAPVELSTDEIAEKLYGDSKSKAFITLFFVISARLSFEINRLKSLGLSLDAETFTAGIFCVPDL